MRRTGFALLALLVTAGLLARGAAPAAHACSVASPGPTLEERVDEADLIFTATVTASQFDPPLDPNTPDEFIHIYKVTIHVDEYLKGSGPGSITYETSHRFWFEADGSLHGTSNNCDPWNQPPVGAPYLVLAGSDGIPVFLDTIQLDTAGGQQFLQQVVAVLNATPTPVPTSSPQPMALPTATPAALPDSGGSNSTPGPGAPIAVAAGIASVLVLLGVAFAWRRRVGAS